MEGQRARLRAKFRRRLRAHEGRTEFAFSLRYRRQRRRNRRPHRGIVLGQRRPAEVGAKEERLDEVRPLPVEVVPVDEEHLESSESAEPAGEGVEVVVADAEGMEVAERGKGVGELGQAARVGDEDAKKEERAEEGGEDAGGEGVAFDIEFLESSARGDGERDFNEAAISAKHGRQ